MTTLKTISNATANNAKAPELKKINDRRPEDSIANREPDAERVRALKYEIASAVQAEINSAFGLAKAFANALEHHYQDASGIHYPIEALQYFHQLLVANNRPRLANRIKELTTKMAIITIGNKDGVDTYKTFKPSDDDQAKMKNGKTAKTADEKRAARKDNAIKWLNAFYKGEINTLTEKCPAIGEEDKPKVVKKSVQKKVEDTIKNLNKLLAELEKENDNKGITQEVKNNINSQLDTLKAKFTAIPVWNPLETQEESDDGVFDAQTDSNPYNYE